MGYRTGTWGISSLNAYIRLMEKRYQVKGKRSIIQETRPSANPRPGEIT
jgi:hypothetical protein